MTGIWAESRDGWHRAAPNRFALEKELHDLIELTPEMLPLAGAPRLALLGREVRCGSGYADLVAVEADTGRPVLIEIKLASNVDRRQVLTQVLGYAAYLRRLDGAAFESLLGPTVSVGTTTAATTQDPAFDVATFSALLEEALSAGRLRCVIVIDQAPDDLVELVGYLQDVTNERLSLDLITVSAYDIGGHRVLVPQLVGPDRSRSTTGTAGGVAFQRSAVPVRGVQGFAASIDQAAEPDRALLHRLLDWALRLEADGLAVLYTSEGKGRWLLNLRLPGQQRGMVTVWNDHGPYLSPYRTTAVTSGRRARPKRCRMFIRAAENVVMPHNLGRVLTVPNR